MLRWQPSSDALRPDIGMRHPYQWGDFPLGLRSPSCRYRSVRDDDGFAIFGDGPDRQCAGPTGYSSIRGRRRPQKEPHQYADNEFRHQSRSAWTSEIIAREGRVRPSILQADMQRRQDRSWVGRRLLPLSFVGAVEHARGVESVTIIASRSPSPGRRPECQFRALWQPARHAAGDADKTVADAL
jgi:hypothetical protein